MRKLVILASIVLLGACSSPPKPSVVGWTDRHPINSSETSKAIASVAQAAQAEEKQRVESRSVTLETKPAILPHRSDLFSAYFPYNSAQFKLTSREARRLIPALANARRIEIRGRTDGKRPSRADERIALSRALAAQRFLIGQGVSPAIISVNYVSAGDYVADNFAAAGRARNRRVDIEVFN
jgi:outer membrane protein OmpA-like peptidoglycan-associated protein